MLESMWDNLGDWAKNSAVEVIVQMVIDENIPQEELEGC